MRPVRVAAADFRVLVEELGGASSCSKGSRRVGARQGAGDFEPQVFSPNSE